MDLHPHLHLLVPSCTPSIQLEARLYLARDLMEGMSKTIKSIPGFSTSSNSTPLPVDQLGYDVLEGLKGVQRLIIASHPWGRFGGNMLYP